MAPETTTPGDEGLPHPPAGAVAVATVTLLFLTAALAGCVGSFGDDPASDPGDRSTGGNESIPIDDGGDSNPCISCGPLNNTGDARLPVDLIWADSGAGQLFRVHPTGNVTPLPLSDPLPEFGLTGMRWGPDGDFLYGVDFDTAALYRVDPAAGTVETVASGDPLVSPIALAVLDDGRALVIDAGDGRSVDAANRSVWAETPRVVEVALADGAARIVALDPRFTALDREDWFGMAAGPDGAAYLVTGTSDPALVTPADPSDDGGRGVLWRIDPDAPAGLNAEIVATHPDWVFPDGLAVLPDGSVVVADWDPTEPGVFRVDPATGDVTLLARIPGASLLWGGEVLPDGRVVVVDGCGNPLNLTEDDEADGACGPGALWTVDPGTGEVQLVALGPRLSFPGHARVWPDAPAPAVATAAAS